MSSRRTMLSLRCKAISTEEWLLGVEAYKEFLAERRARVATLVTRSWAKQHDLAIRWGNITSI
jgi:hypothetical protein